MAEKVDVTTETGTAATPFIICDNLVKIYKIADLEVVALQGLDLLVQSGELLGIVGASGSGKSTLMNVLGGLDRPSAGRAWVAGKDLLKLSDRDLNQYRRAEVGFVWQHGARNLVAYLDAFANVKLPMTLAGKAGRRVNERAKDLLGTVGLGDRMHHKLSELSGGEQQRVAIAVALANEPKILLADEPTGELDSATALRIYELLNDLNRQFGLTTLIVSHDPGIARHVHRVVAIRDGRLATETVRSRANGTPSVRPGGGATASGHEASDDIFEELTVLDSAGRLQIPKEYLLQFGIKGRARLEITEEGILVLPADRVSLDHVRDTSALATGLAEARKARGIGGLLNRLTRGEFSRKGRE
ncbi:MAG: ABC transporter ATP-binding protein [Anaerolineae bacterium]|jgi:ABC-type lipoprotein export system ATPase subunit/bifunctional DNA-binding transcriptional regulator/antitoxin component of YhaV-PrlF toxin-antitoxin module|nr:ABC transporter ATP-binding protein [Anaerolineae bacterium]